MGEYDLPTVPNNLPPDWGSHPGDASYGHEDTQRVRDDDDEKKVKEKNGTDAKTG